MVQGGQRVREDPTADQEHRRGADHSEHAHEARCRCEQATPDPARQAGADAGAGAARQMQPRIIEFDDASDEAVNTDRHQQRDRHQHPDAGAERCGADDAERDHDDLRREDEIRADRTFDLVAFEGDQVDRRVCSGCADGGAGGNGVLGGMQPTVRELLEAFVTEEQAAEHHQRRDQPRQEQADEQRRRHQDRLVDERAFGDSPHHGQLACSLHTRDLFGVDREVIAQHTGAFLCRHLGEHGDIIEHRRDVIEQGEEADAGHQRNLSGRRTSTSTTHITIA